MSFTIIDSTLGKESARPGRPLVLCQITAVDGDTAYLSTAVSTGNNYISWNGHNYLCKIQNNVIDAIQDQSPQGYDIPGSINLTIADGDFLLWTNHIRPHGWRGAALTVTFLLWDIPSNTYSTDSYNWSFIAGKPNYDAGAGIIKLEAIALTSMTRLKVPNVPRQNRCSHTFPTTAAQRLQALTDPTSAYYACGYCADQSGVGFDGTGTVGNLSGGIAITSCDYTRQTCMANGMFSTDSSSRATYRFDGDTWLPPQQYSGRQYTTGQKVYGFNPLNNGPGQYYNIIYGTQWVDCTVLEPAGDPNSLRAECVVCVAGNGPAYIQKLLVNGVEIPQSGDKLFTWRYNGAGGGRTGAINTDAIFDGNGDPGGSLCKVEFVVPVELAAGGSIPHVQALVNGPPTLKCYPISTVTGSGGNLTVTFTSGVADVDIGNGQVLLSGVSGFAGANGCFSVTGAAVYGPPGQLTLSASLSGSGTGGAVFYCRSNTNPVWHLLDLITMWGPFRIQDIDPVSWYNAASDCNASVSYTARDGSTQAHERYRSSFVLAGTQRQILAQAVLALRNNAGMILSKNHTTGLLECFIEKTLADQQPAPVSGSNYNTPVASVTASGSAANGYLAYLFDGNGSIEKNTLNLGGRSINDTPNVVNFPFQDEDNSWQQDSISTIDANGYISSGNQEINVPLQIIGVPNFDQGTRRSNVEIAKALYGNPRFDSGGTELPDILTTFKAAHLKPGMICGIKYDQLSL